MKKVVAKRLKLSPAKSIVDSLLKDIKESKNEYYKDVTIKTYVEQKSSISFKNKSGDQVDLVVEPGSGENSYFVVNKKGCGLWPDRKRPRVYKVRYEGQYGQGSLVKRPGQICKGQG